jgi:geranylgeranyl reductase family protein
MDRKSSMTSPGTKKTDIVIIGAGPIGSYTAYRLSKLGYKIRIFEEHPEAGRPEQCAGLVNNAMFELPGLDLIKDRVLLHEIIGSDIFSPRGNVLRLRAGKVKAVSMDRALFDKELLRNAVRNGGDLYLSTKVTEIKPRKDGDYQIITRGVGGKEEIKAQLVIGCDGAASIVRSQLGFERPSSTIPGAAMQVEINGGETPTDLVAVLTGEETAKGFFAWAVPAGSRSSMRIGLAAEDGASLRKGIMALSTDKRLLEWIGSQEATLGRISMNFGPVPMGSPKTIIKDKAVILGDSAGMAKPTSGGGIYPGLLAANDLATSIQKEGEVSIKALDGFRSSWLTGYGRELERSRFFRKIISQVKDEEIEEVIERLSDPVLLKIINEEGDIDHPLRLALLLIRKDPSLLKLVPRFLPHMRKLI